MTMIELEVQNTLKRCENSSSDQQDESKIRDGVYQEIQK